MSSGSIKKMHSGEKPYMCDNGSKCLIKSTKLSIEIYTGKKLYKCTECLKSLSQNSNLQH